MKAIIQSVLLWHGQYRITELQPEHISATCYVFKAVDEHRIESETGQPIKVALKLMRMKTQVVPFLLSADLYLYPLSYLSALSYLYPLSYLDLVCVFQVPLPLFVLTSF